MIFFKASAFTKLDNFDVVGNPANVILFDEAEEMNLESMSKISYGRFPITVFLKRRSGGDFDLRYYTKDGKEFDLCGHGTICAAGVAKDFYENDIPDVIFFYLKDGSTIKSLVKDGRVTINFPIKEVEIIEDISVQKKLREILNIKESDAANFYHSKMMGDYIVHLNDYKVLRNIEPNLDLLLKYSKELECRVMSVFAKNSGVSGINLEVRVFSQFVMGKEEGDGEDVTCGSANCSIASIVEADFYKVLFPYQYNITGKFGGLQFIKCNADDKSIDLTGGYEVNERNISF